MRGDNGVSTPPASKELVDKTTRTKQQ